VRSKHALPEEKLFLFRIYFLINTHFSGAKNLVREKSCEFYWGKEVS